MLYILYLLVDIEIDTGNGEWKNNYYFFPIRIEDQLELGILYLFEKSIAIL